MASLSAVTRGRSGSRVNGTNVIMLSLLKLAINRLIALITNEAVKELTVRTV